MIYYYIMKHQNLQEPKSTLILRPDEKLRRRYPASIEEFGRGTLFYTDRRVCFVSDRHGLCFDLHFENMYNWGRDRHNLYITWYEPENLGKWLFGQPRHVVKIRIGGEKYNGQKLTTFDVAYSLYYAYEAHYRYGQKASTVYPDVISIDPLRMELFDRWKEMSMPWKNVVARQERLSGTHPLQTASADKWWAEIKWIYHSIGHFEDYPFLKPPKGGKMTGRIEDFENVELYAPKCMTNLPDVKDPITGHIIAEPGLDDTLLFHDMLNSHRLTLAFLKSQLVDDHRFRMYDGEVPQSEIEKKFSELVKRVEDQDRLASDLAAKVSHFRNVGDEKSLRVIGREKTTDGGIGLLGLEFAHGKMDQEQWLEYEERRQLYNHRILEIMRGEIANQRFKKIGHYVAHLKILHKLIGIKFYRGDDSEISTWGPEMPEHEGYIEAVEDMMPKIRQKKLAEPI